MAQNVDLFVSEKGNIRGPLRLEAIRRDISSGVMKDALFRMEGCKRFLPGTAWDPLSDLYSAPSPPDPPDGVVAESLPRDLAKLEPAPRDKLLWYVEDADGVMGPVTGAFIARGLMAGRIPISSAVSLVSVPGWIRGTAVFPAALESATAIRARPLGTFTCPFCFEPVIVGSPTCLMCGESVAIGEPPIGAARSAIIVFGGLAIVLTPLLAGAISAQRDASRVSAPELPAAAPAVSAPSALSAPSASSAVSPFAPSPLSAPSALPAASAFVPAKEERTPPSTNPKEASKLSGQVVAKIDVPPDAEGALLLPHGHVAVARRAALDVIDPQSGVVVTSSREAQSARVIERIGDALYAVGPSRVAVLEPETLRVMRWIEPRVPLGAGAAAADIGVFPSPIDRSVVVMGTPHHVEIARFRFGADVPSLVAIDPSGGFAAVAVADPRSRIGADSIQVFSPRVSPGAQIVRRVALGDPVAALAVRDGHAFVALGSSRVVRVALDAEGLLAGPDLTRDTCADPVLVRAAPGAVLVGCRTGRALSLHAPATLAQDTRIELGGPVVAIEISPSSAQALVATGAPSAAVFLVDLATGEPSRVDVTDEITSVRFGKDGARATAFSARARRVWVLK